MPHQAKSNVVKSRGIRKLTPAHKKNNIVISDGKISGLDNLSRVEYEDVIQLFNSLGVPLPERPQRTRKFVHWRKELQFSDPPKGWLSPEGWGIGDQIHGYDASKDRKASVDRIVAEAGGVNSLMREKKVRRKQVDGDWTSEGGWIAKEKKAEELDEEEVKEWEPTQLVGEMEVDPDGYTPRFPIKGMDKYEFVEEEYEQGAAPRDDYDALAAAEQEAQEIAQQRRNARAGPSTEREPPPPGFPDTQPPALFSAEDLDKMPDVSFAAPVRLDLAGLGPGWLEEVDLSTGAVSAKQRRVSAADRMKTFQRLGIKVPDLVRRLSSPTSQSILPRLTPPRSVLVHQGRIRTVAEDWALLESWDGVEGSKDKGWRYERLSTPAVRTAERSARHFGQGRTGGRSSGGGGRGRK